MSTTKTSTETHDNYTAEAFLRKFSDHLSPNRQLRIDAARIVLKELCELDGNCGVKIYDEPNMHRTVGMQFPQNSNSGRPLFAYVRRGENDARIDIKIEEDQWSQVELEFDLMSRRLVGATPVVNSDGVAVKLDGAAAVIKAMWDAVEARSSTAALYGTFASDE